MDDGGEGTVRAPELVSKSMQHYISHGLRHFYWSLLFNLCATVNMEVLILGNAIDSYFKPKLPGNLPKH